MQEKLPINSSEIALGVITTALLIKNILLSVSIIMPFKGYVYIATVLIIITCLVFTIESVYRNSGIEVYALLLLTVAYFLFQILFFQSNEEYIIGDSTQIIIYGIIPFVLASSTKRYDAMLYIFKKCAYAIVIAASASVFFMYTTGDLNADYSMAFGNSAIVGTVILEHYVLEEGKPHDIGMFGLGIISTLLCGSRGPFLSVISYYILHVVFSESKTIRWLVRNGIILVILSAIYSNLYDIAETLQQLLLRYDIKSRTLLLFLDGRIVQGSGREEVYKLCFKLIDEKWMFGIGYDGLKGLGYHNLTPHNTYLELVLYNGIFIGTALALILTIVWIKGIIVNRRSALNTLCLVFFSLYVPRSFIGAGGIEKIDFWLLLAFSILNVKLYKESKRWRSAQKLRNDSIDTIADGAVLQWHEQDNDIPHEDDLRYALRSWFVPDLGHHETRVPQQFDACLVNRQYDTYMVDGQSDDFPVEERQIVKRFFERLHVLQRIEARIHAHHEGLSVRDKTLDSSLGSEGTSQTQAKRDHRDALQQFIQCDDSLDAVDYFTRGGKEIHHDNEVRTWGEDDGHTQARLGRHFRYFDQKDDTDVDHTTQDEQRDLIGINRGAKKRPKHRTD